MSAFPDSSAGDGPAKPEFSRPVRVASLEKSDQHHHWLASAEECAALARRYGIVAVKSLEARVHLRPRGGKGVLADIAFAADVEQRSVISLETVNTRISEEATVRYLPPETIAEIEAAAEDEEREPADEDMEPINGETIDIGETIAQQLSLSLDPYPRQQGERLEDYWAPDDDAMRERHPFDVLKNL